MKHLIFFLALALLAISPPAHSAQPNILWFVVDDMSPHFSCYGETTITTPNIDRLAAEGTRFTRAYVTAPVCSTCRSALITGLYQTTIGAQHHRSGRGDLKIHLPEGVTPVPALFQKAGYFTCIGSGLPGKDNTGQDLASRKNKKGKPNQAPFGKTDYNFEWDPAIYNSPDWADRGDKPFFMQVQLHGGKLREGPMEKRAAYRQRVLATFGNVTDPERVTLPPYYPRDPVLLQDWADYLDAVRLTDHHVGQVIARLEKENLLENTLIIFMTDHGISHARGKQFLYNEGTHVPFIVRGPGIPKASVRDDLIEQIDMAPTSLAAASLPIPPAMQGRNLFAKDYTPRTEVFAARDRCDETTENLRSIRTDRFLYIRNGHPQRPHLQPNAYKDGKALIEALRRLHAAGELPPLTERLLFSPTRPPEELYLWREDPWQLNNLADDPAHQADLEACRTRLDHWMRDMRDPPPETEAEYDSDMAAYIGKGNPVVERNVAAMKRQAAAERDQQPVPRR